ncbi:MAG: formylglycine-generating enzyme family protein [Verrucomicrobia bacterium]|nr:formylglycine-generating enzyme family protein [Verrucomicrobiota bacterium]
MRLPSEAEWERAAKGTTHILFSLGQRASGRHAGGLRRLG